MLSRTDLAKYPFTVDAVEYVKGLEFKLEDFSGYEQVADRAVERLKESALRPVRDGYLPGKEERMGDEGRRNVEILSFPLAIIMMKSVGDPYFQKRFALYEAKKASGWLENDDTGKIVEIARKNFGWKVSQDIPAKMLKLHFSDYLRNASKLREDKWKLVNRSLEYGDVYITKTDAARLLEEEVRQHIYSKFQGDVEVELPQTLGDRVAELKTFFQAQKKALPSEEKLGEVDSKAFPPCIASMYMQVLSGKNVSHIGRFTLTAFLLNVGASTEEVSKLYTSATDFDERLTRYQVEHIAGVVGGRVKYKPLTCANMRTHRLCSNPDETCSKIRHPLQYYGRKKRSLKT